MQYPHWLMVAGAVLVVVGFIGFALHKNNAEQVENNLKQEAPPNPLQLGGAEAKANGERTGTKAPSKSPPDLLI
jgi:hypothetical protein